MASRVSLLEYLVLYHYARMTYREDSKRLWGARAGPGRLFPDPTETNNQLQCHNRAVLKTRYRLNSVRNDKAPTKTTTTL